jgi:non-heme chloroperoxidase
VAFIDLPTGIRMHYRDAGSGPAIVFLPGFAGTLETWDYAVLDLHERFRCVCPDLRGHGRSDKPATGYSYDDMAADVGALLTLLDLRDVTLTGWSMGAAVGLKYVTGHQDGSRVARLATVGSAAPRYTQTREEPYGADDATAAATLEGIRRSYPETLAAFAEANFHRTDLEATKAWMRSLWQSLPAYAAYAYMRTLIEEDLRPHVERVSIPTALFHGRHDRVCDPRWSEYMAARIPGARLVWFDDSGHLPMIEEPDKFSRELAAFAG